VVTGALAATGVLGAGAAVATARGRSTETGVRAVQQSASGQTQSSANWAGYVAEASGGTPFRRVTGSWTVPSVSNRSSDGYSAFWVGLGGASSTSQALEQVGTSSDVSNGQASYYAWYELVPAAEQRLSLTVHPGDRMTGAVSVSGTQVTVRLSDSTTGQSVAKTLKMASPDTSSAEWIAEAPSVETQDGQVMPTPLADFGKVTFTDATATAGSHTGPVNDAAWRAAPIDLQGAGTGYLGAGRRFGVSDVTGASSAAAAPGSLSSDGSSFTVTYGAGANTTTSTRAGYGSDDPYGLGYGYGDYAYGDGYGGYGGGDYGSGGGYDYGYGDAGRLGV
jgi:hypothetical protein